jgi:hypothetical protein
VLLTLFYSTAILTADASDICTCSACQTLVQQEFQPKAVKSCINTASDASYCEPACSWQLLDIQWCAAPSGAGDKRRGYSVYTLTARGVSGRGCPYTDDCRVCLERGGGCRVANATGAEHPVAPKDAGLAAASLGLEAYHMYTIVYLKFNKVGFEPRGCGSMVFFKELGTSPCSVGSTRRSLHYPPRGRRWRGGRREQGGGRGRKGKWWCVCVGGLAYITG